jgi:hypothetical protein
MLAARKDYPLSLLFATASGEYMPLVNLAIKDAKGASALTVPSTGPICLISRAGRIAASRRGAEVRTTDCPGGQFALHQGAISRCDLRVEDGKKWSCCGRIPDAIPFSMASARLLEALEDLAACLRVAARCSPADFPKWSDAPPNHFAEIERLWSDIRPRLRRDLAAADEVNEGLGAMISAFETGDAVRVREIAEAMSRMDLVGLR